MDRACPESADRAPESPNSESPNPTSTNVREVVAAAVGVLNGAIGDYLVRTSNGLAIDMTLVSGQTPVAPTAEDLARAFPELAPTPARIVVLLHGLMNTEASFRFPDGTDYATLLARDFGFVPLTLRYNSGRAISENGERFAAILDALSANFPRPVEEILLVGYSMGGLVIRSACHVAAARSLPWLSLVRRAIYVGTPHLGAPLERVGRVVTRLLRTVGDPYADLVAQLADLRSAGIVDLGDADLRQVDREATARRGPGLRDPRHPVPLLPEIAHYLVAGSLVEGPLFAALFGDAMVPLKSATNGACADTTSIALPPSHVRVLRKINHAALARHPAVYEAIAAFAAPEQGAAR